jgi:hypothetical protein
MTYRDHSIIANPQLFLQHLIKKLTLPVPLLSSYGSWIYKYPYNHCLSPLFLWVSIPLRWGVLHTSLCDKVCQWLEAGRWFSLGTPVSSTNKTDRHDITAILLKVVLNTIALTLANLYHIASHGNTLYFTCFVLYFFSFSKVLSVIRPFLAH